MNPDSYSFEQQMFDHVVLALINSGLAADRAVSEAKLVINSRREYFKETK